MLNVIKVTFLVLWQFERSLMELCYVIFLFLLVHLKSYILWKFQWVISWSHSKLSMIASSDSVFWSFTSFSILRTSSFLLHVFSLRTALADSLALVKKWDPKPASTRTGLQHCAFDFKNRYLEKVLREWIRVGPTHIGDFPVCLHSTSRYRYVTGVTSNSSKENIGQMSRHIAAGAEAH